MVTVKLTGSYESGRGVLGVLKKAIAGAGEKIVVDLDGADFLADEVADVLRRAAAAAAAAGIAFDLHATRPGVRRFLTRHRLRGS